MSLFPSVIAKVLRENMKEEDMVLTGIQVISTIAQSMYCIVLIINRSITRGSRER